MTSTEPVNGLTGSATLGDGYAPSGTIHFNRYRPSGSAVDKGTATVHATGSNSTATGYTQPAQGTATGTDQWNVSYAGDGNNTTACEYQRPGGTDGGERHQPHAHRAPEL